MANIAIDFDGVIHRYSRGWQDGSIYDPPMDGALETCMSLTGFGHRLILFTTRARDPEQQQPLADWLERHGFAGLFSEVTAVKPLCHVLVDDRAVRFQSWPQAIADIAAALGG